MLERRPVDISTLLVRVPHVVYRLRPQWEYRKVSGTKEGDAVLLDCWEVLLLRLFFSVTFIVCRIVGRVTASPAGESLNQHETSTFLDLPLVSDDVISGADRPEEADKGRRSGERTVHAFRAGKVDAFKGGSY